MNVNFIKIASLTREVKGLRIACERIAECLEVQLSMQGYNVRPPKADTSGPEPELKYTEEDMDWANEQLEQMKRYKESE